MMENQFYLKFAYSDSFSNGLKIDQDLLSVKVLYDV